jgi:hypothetical protein
MPFAAVVFDEQFVKRLKQRHEFLQAAGDRAGRQMQVVAAQFGQDAIERLKEFEFPPQNEHPERNADTAFGKEFVRRRGRDYSRLIGTSATTPIALAMIAASMGADLDFEDVAVGRAGNFLERLMASGTALLVVGQVTRLMGGGQMIVVASAMAPATALLAAGTFWLAGGGLVRGLGRGGSFRASTKDATF